MSEDPGELLRRAAGVRSLVGRVLDALAARRSECTGAIAAQRTEQTARSLIAMPVERLRDVTDDRLRIAPLRDAGFETVFDVYRSTPAELDAIPNIGSTTASQLLAAANQIAHAAGRVDNVHLDPGDRTATSTALLLAVDRFEHLRRDTAPVRGTATTLAAQLEGHLHAARPARGRVRYFLTFGRKKEAARNALAALEQMLATPATISLVDRLAGIEDASSERDAAAPDVDALWLDYERNGAAVMTAIAQVDADSHAGRFAGDPSQGRMPDEIVDRIRALDLDESYLTVSLRGYQEFGAKFALVQGKAILGDEMGLGKTVQAIAAMAHLQAQGEAHFMVVCPASVLVNWTHEISRHSSLLAARVHGDARDALLETWAREGGVAVTTFETMRSMEIPAEVEISLLVVDEAHYVKNADSLRSRAIDALVDRSARALFMTGTPMENRVDEFRTLVGYLRPDVAATLDRTVGVAGADAFRKAVAPVYLRRNQDDVLTELPERIEQEDWVELSADDLEAYRDAVASGNFMAMRRAAYVVDDVERSAKLGRLAQILADAADDGRKVIVFSFFLDVLDVVHRLGAPHVFGPLTGSVPPVERQALVDRFSAVDGYAVLVSQIQAGGVGLNIQAASVVVLTEPQWKPSTEEQAIARCHRMGQTRRVQVHRLLAEDCVDSLLLEVVRRKRALFDDYARESDLKDTSPDAMDVSEAESVRQIVTVEQQRLSRGRPVDELG